MGEVIDLRELSQGANDLSEDYNRELKPIQKFAVTLLNENIDGAIADISDNYPKIGVFGPYVGDGRQVITEICWYVAERGNVVFTDFGYYHPDDPRRFISLDAIFPPSLVKIVKDQKIMGQLAEEAARSAKLRASQNGRKKIIVERCGVEFAVLEVFRLVNDTRARIIRCSSCGALNSEDRDICSKCVKTLKS
jgi:hypothetical protein